MPQNLLKPCAILNCPNLVKSGKAYCSYHEKQKKQKKQKYYHSYYSSKWRQEREQFLIENILCIECLKEGKEVKATIVDHIVSHKGNKILFWDKKNWQPLCKRHHDIKTAKIDNGGWKNGKGY